MLHIGLTFQCVPQNIIDHCKGLNKYGKIFLIVVTNLTKKTYYLPQCFMYVFCGQKRTHIEQHLWFQKHVLFLNM
jgi:hypothetical protein